ncbi:hypothetical protein RCL_jg21757.t1 [Rhizophagus clarus]|uniref:Uncharacterized protein n=1 Tax=Rhizophagus clarus TaxID=94130 RepID=A0A8H3L449_9GLOM|nr:hypothetical protein RCL_jg21757.t1 [Rhizophagus clarus]
MIYPLSTYFFKKLNFLLCRNSDRDYNYAFKIRLVCLAFIYPSSIDRHHSAANSNADARNFSFCDYFNQIMIHKHVRRFTPSNLL